VTDGEAPKEIPDFNLYPLQDYRIKKPYVFCEVEITEEIPGIERGKKPANNSSGK